MSLILALLILAVTPADKAAAIADHERYAALGQVTSYVEVNQRQEPVVKLLTVIASREALLDEIVPSPLPGTSLVRINLTALAWSDSDWATIFGNRANGYTPHDNPLIVPGGFYIEALADGTRSDAMFRFHFGRSPKTVAEFWSAVDIDPDKQRGLSFGLVEGSSGVNVARNGARLLSFFDGVHSEAWETLDVKRIEPGRDPLEALDRKNFKADGSEIFVLRPVVSTSGVRGLLPITALADGTGKLVAEAPVDLVLDHTKAGGLVSIRNQISCLSCHSKGPNIPSVNALRDRLAKGVELKADQKRKIEIELFHLGDGAVAKALVRWEQGYAEAVQAIAGMQPEAWSKQFNEVVSDYRADVTLERAAAELDATADELRLALGYASLNKIDVDNRLAGLAHGISMPRSDFSKKYLKLQTMLDVWRTKGER